MVMGVRRSPYKALFKTYLYIHPCFCLWIASSSPVVPRCSKRCPVCHLYYISFICQSTSTSHSYPSYSAQGLHQRVSLLAFAGWIRSIEVCSWVLVVATGNWNRTGNKLKKQKREVVFAYLFPQFPPCWVISGWLPTYTKSHNVCQAALSPGSGNCSLSLPIQLRVFK